MKSKDGQWRKRIFEQEEFSLIHYRSGRLFY